MNITRKDQRDTHNLLVSYEGIGIPLFPFEVSGNAIIDIFISSHIGTVNYMQYGNRDCSHILCRRAPSTDSIVNIVFSWLYIASISNMVTKSLTHSFSSLFIHLSQIIHKSPTQIAGPPIFAPTCELAYANWLIICSTGPLKLSSPHQAVMICMLMKTAVLWLQHIMQQDSISIFIMSITASQGLYLEGFWVAQWSKALYLSAWSGQAWFKSRLYHIQLWLGVP